MRAFRGYAVREQEDGPAVGLFEIVVMEGEKPAIRWWDGTLLLTRRFCDH